MRQETMKHPAEGDILIVENTRSDLKLLTEILTDAGYKVRPARDGELALRAVKTKLPELILMDVTLPGIDGVEVCRRLKADPETSDIPIVFLSTLGETELKVKALDAGGVDYVTRPFESSEVLARTSTHLKVYRLQRELAVQSEELRAVIEALNKWEMVFRHSGWGVVIADAHTNEFLSLNPAFAEMHGYSVEEMLKIKLDDAFSEEDRALLPSRAEQVHKSGDLVFESIHVRKDGSLFPALTHVRAIYDEQGEVQYRAANIQDITELKKTEESLRLTQFSVDRLTDAVYWMGPDASFVYVNDAATEALGYSEEELLTMTVHDINPEYPVEIWVPSWAELKEKKSFVIQTTHQRKDGSTFPVEISLNYVQFGEHEINVAIARDITERHRELNAQKESEALLFAIAENYPNSFISIIEEDYTVGFTSGQEFKNQNIDPEQFIGLTLDQVFGENTAIVREHYERTFRGQECTFELFVNDQHQLYRTVPLRSEDESIHRILAVVENITERILIEEKLKQSEESFRNLVETSQDLIFKCDDEGRFTYLNPYWETTHGYPLDEMLGRAFTEFVHPDRADVDSEEFSRLLQGGRVSAWEDTHISKTGEEIYLVFDVVPIRDRDGNIVGTQGTAHDVTRSRRLEEEKLSLERQVLHAQKLESLGILAGGIAHDFNNLLMTVLGNADIALQDLARHSPARSSIETIVETAHKAAGLSKQMLAYSGRGSFVIESIALNVFVREMVHLLDVSISKNAVLKYNFAENLPGIQGDATQIRQIIMNLIINASEAIGVRSGVISLSTGAMECDPEYLSASENISTSGLEESLAEGMYVYLEVADTGCGMDNETQEKLFDPFFTTKFTGRGLGMAATLGIVRGHHGMIKVYSEVDKGTTIKVLFPATEPEVSDSGGAPDRAAFADWRGSGKILVADDEETVCAVTGQYLERLGFEVITAADGREAIEMFREHSKEIVCVLLDMTMPHVDGREAFREIRKIQKDARVILCSGYNERDATQHFIGKGLAGFLQKPYRSAELREKLMAVLS